jgi:uncharacterized protein
MKLSWDEAKKQATLRARGLDFASVTELFDGLHFTAEDTRRDYGESRYVSAGRIAGRLCVVVWTPRDGSQHIISLRKANDREQKRFEAALEQE